jgi:nucleoside-diphosphate-sugar epimerase
MEGRDVLVTGGTGRLGRRVVDRLRAEGLKPRVMSRSGQPGTIKGDLLTGEGIEAAVRGADTIIHAAQSPTRNSRRTAVGGTERLLEVAAGSGVSHFVYISVVGLEHVPLSYGRGYPLGGATITTTPTMQIVAPSRSHLSGLNPSTMIPHTSDKAMKMPP